MRLENNHEIASKSRDFETKKFGIADMSIVMTLLTKLYSHPKRTLTQEYISNARDANREVNSKRPIEITAPSTWFPNLLIRDFGPGLSEQRINDVFLYYGASTKNKDNTQTGGFGIGAKSAWAYTNSFVVISYVDGVKRTYACHKSGGNGNLDLISEENTKEPNGAEIQIPINTRDVAEFKSAVLRTIFYWDKSERPILKGFDEFNYDMPGYDEYKINDQVYMVKNGVPDFVVDYASGGFRRENIIIVDGIPYASHGQISSALEKITKKVKCNYIIKLNTGDLRIAPTREELVFEDDNIKKCRQISENAVKAVDLIIQNELSRYSEIKDKVKHFIYLFQMFSIDNKCDAYTIRSSGNHIDYMQLIYNDGKKLNFGHWDYKGRIQQDSSLCIKNIDSLYYDDVEESKAKRKYRIEKMGRDVRLVTPPTILPDDFDKLAAYQKQLILERKIEKSDFDKICRDLEAKPLSSFSIADYAKPKAVSSGVVKKEVCLHLFDTARLSPTQFDLNDVKDEIVYASLDSEHYANRDSDEYNKLTYYLNSLGKKMAFVAKGSISKLEEIKTFSTLDEFLENHLPDEKSIKMSLSKLFIEKYRQLWALREIPECDTIQSKDLKFIIEMFKIGKDPSYHSGVSVPFSLFKNMRDSKFFTDAKSYIDNYEVKLKEILDKYALLEHCLNWNVHRNKAARLELIYYLNSKE